MIIGRSSWIAGIEKLFWETLNLQMVRHTIRTTHEYALLSQRSKKPYEFYVHGFTLPSPSRVHNESLCG